ncbi:MAG: TetR/AcrR family transcriptional regulator [Kofleriaceae bacterium]
MRATPETQEAILATALDEFGTEGYEGASLNKILLAAGLSKGAFYYYFDDKADLAAAVLERELRRWDFSELELGDSAASFWTALERYARKGLERLRAAPKSRDVLVRLGAAASRDPALRERLSPYLSAGHEHLIAAWERGQELGAVRSDLPAATLITLAQGAKSTLGAAMLPSDGPATDAELETFTRVYIDLLRRMTQETPP